MRRVQILTQAVGFIESQVIDVGGVTDSVHGVQGAEVGELVGLVTEVFVAAECGGTFFGRWSPKSKFETSASVAQSVHP